MGRPIKRTAFGPATSGSGHISVTGIRFADGTTATSGYIVKQTGSNAYVVSNGVKSETVFMVNAANLAALLPGQCYILGTPFGESSRPCAKIAQFRVDIFDTAKTTPAEVGAPITIAVKSYVWGTTPATGPGQADILQ